MTATRLRPLPSLALAVLLLAAPSALRAAGHDLLIAASINSSGRVMGSGTGAPDGLYVRAAGQEAFGHVGANMPLLITVVADPRERSRLYAAGLSGVMRSADGGATWRILTGWAETEPKALALDPVDPDTVYAGLPDGFVLSNDRGQTWRRAEAGLPDRGKYVQCLQVDRTVRGRILLGCESGIWLSEDGAASWRRVFAAVDTVNDIQQSPHDPARWLAVSQSAGVLESTDGGRTWAALPGLPREQAWYNVAFHPRDPARLALASWTFGLWASADGGRTWTERNAGLPAPTRVWRTAFDPDDGRLYAAVYERALYASTDLGGTWTETALPGSVIRSFTFVPVVR
jgi:hypothetical protein